jgi:hypothetical protein
MTRPPENPGHVWQVHLSQAVAESLFDIQAQATEEGRGEEALAAFRQIVARLHSDPMGVGEPNYRLPGLRLLIRRVAVRPLVVHFAVSEDRPLVFIRSVKLLSK